MSASPYLELNWLAKSDKYILLPPVVFADIPYGGYFCPPEKKEVLLADKYYPLDRGLIVISEIHSEHIESSIAHEWRHLWQRYQYGRRTSVAKWNLKSPLSYKKQIIKFFSTDLLEYDALLFQLKKAPDDVAKQWYEWIVKK